MVQGNTADMHLAYPWTRWLPLQKWAIRASLLQGTVFVSPNAGIVEWMRSEVGVPARNAYVIENGFDGERVQQALESDLDRSQLAGVDPGRYAVFVGTFAAWQGIDTLIRAVNDARWPADLPLVMVGDGAEESSVRRAAASNALIRPVGRVAPDVALAWTAGAAVALAPRRSGPASDRGVSPYKVLEAAALGVPVVASRVRGQTELVDELGNGALVSPDAPEELAQAVRDLWHDADERERLSHEGRRRSLRYSWAARHAQLCEALVRATEPVAARPRPVFSIAVADYANVGDALIRREALRLVARAPALHLYTGPGGDEWVSALDVPDGAVLYDERGQLRWLRELARSTRPVLLFDPGEVRFTPPARRWEAAFLCATVLARLRRGHVVRIARATTGEDRVARGLHSLGVRLSQEVSWRTAESHDEFGRGQVVADIAVGAAPGVEEHAGGELVVSLRHDRPFPSDAWIAGIQDVARRQGLGLRVVSQVRGDDQRTLELAARLDAPTMIFEARSLREQEDALREVYRSATLVVSDRLHVLVLAGSLGAKVLELVDRPAPKITRHFRVIGIAAVSIDSDGLTAEEIVQAVEEVLAHETRPIEAFRRAAGRRAVVESSLQRLVAGH